MNEQLIEYLQSCRLVLEGSSKIDRKDSKGFTYLYFAKIHERLYIHCAENLLNHGCHSPLAITRTIKDQDDLLNFRPYFDEAFAKHKIVSIASREFLNGIWNLSDRSSVTFIKKIQNNEK